MKWTKKLTKRELEHLAETSSTGRPNLRELRANIAEQRSSRLKGLDLRCWTCEEIARKLGLDVQER